MLPHIKATLFSGRYFESSPNIETIINVLSYFKIHGRVKKISHKKSYKEFANTQMII